MISSLVEVHQILDNAASEPSPLIPPAHYHQFRELIRSLGNPGEALKWFNDPNHTAYTKEPAAPGERLIVLLATVAEQVQRSDVRTQALAAAAARGAARLEPAGTPPLPDPMFAPIGNVLTNGSGRTVDPKSLLANADKDRATTLTYASLTNGLGEAGLSARRCAPSSQY